MSILTENWTNKYINPVGYLNTRTDVVTIRLTIDGARNPQMLATQFVTPIIVPAWLEAMSMWFTCW